MSELRERIAKEVHAGLSRQSQQGHEAASRISFATADRILALLEDKPAEAEPLTDAKAAYMNLRTCICSEDASAHVARDPGNRPSCGGFDPNWGRVRKWIESLALRTQEAEPMGYDKSDVYAAWLHGGWNQAETAEHRTTFDEWLRKREKKKHPVGQPQRGESDG